MPPRRTRASTGVSGGREQESAPAPQEEPVFFPDNESTPRGKNDALASVLRGSANSFAILSIRRIEIGGTGWLITRRT